VNRRFLRFLAVGGLNTLFGYACFAGLVFAGLDYRVAVLLSTILGVLFNFTTTGRVVFGNRANRLILRFVGVYAIVYIVHLSALRILIGGLGVNTYVANGICILPIAVLSYLLLRRFVFRTP